MNITNSAFNDNYSNEHLVKMMQAITILDNCTFDNNFSKGGTHGWALGSKSTLIGRKMQINNDQETVSRMMQVEV